MNSQNFISTGILTAFMTACVTIATCIISNFQGYKRMKVENFDKIYNSLTALTDKRAEIVDKCNKLIKEMADALPNKVQEMPDQKWEKLCRNTYYSFNTLLMEYSKCLELLLSFSHYLYRNRPIAPIVTAECWSILNIYESFANINRDKYCIRNGQIVTLVQFIKRNGNLQDKILLRQYLKRNT